MAKTDPLGEIARATQRAAREDRAKQLLLPLWKPLPMRAMPTQVARSALFTARRDRDLEDVHLNKALIHTDDAVIAYTGPLLNQSHADVWLAITFLCRVQKMTRIRVRGDELISLMREGAPSPDRRIRVTDRASLLKRVKSLAEGHLSVKYNDGGSAGAHLISYHRDDEDTYRIEIPAATLELFWDDCVLIDWAVRAAIKGQLAKWLHTYFAATMDPVLVERVRELSASDTKDPYRFRQAVRDALGELMRASAERRAAAVLPELLITNAEVRGKYARATNDPRGELPKLPPAKRGKP